MPDSLCLCEITIADPVEKDSQFFRCQTCDLVYKSHEMREPPDVEIERYKLHNNSIKEPGYVQFLKPALEIVINNTNPGNEGLDFGCGPGPTLSLMLEEQGRKCLVYDPFFFPNEGLLKKEYDFITCTEVVEHFYHPRKEFLKLKEMLKPGAFIVIQTLLADEVKHFESWWYARDPSHVSFYSLKSFNWVAQQLNFKIDIKSDRHLIMHLNS